MAGPFASFFGGGAPAPQVAPGPYQSNVNPFGGLVQGILGPTANQRTLAQQQSEFNVTQQRTTDEGIAQGKVAKIVGDLLAAGVPPNQLYGKVMATPEFASLVAAHPDAGTSLTNIITSIVNANTPAVENASPGSSPITVDRGQGTKGVSILPPVPTTEQQNAKAGITKAENQTEKEAATARLVASGVIDARTRDLILAGALHVQPVLDNAGHTTGYDLVDETGTIAPRHLSFGNSDVAKLAEPPPSANGPGGAVNKPTGTPPAATPQANPNETSFLNQHRANDRVDIAGLDPNFSTKATNAIHAAEVATGTKVVITSGKRTNAEQAGLYANYKAGTGGLAAPPGKSFHEVGDAIDIAPGPALDWLHAHAAEYGVEFLKGDAFAKDPVHMQLAGGGGGGGSNSAANGPAPAQGAPPKGSVVFPVGKGGSGAANAQATGTGVSPDGNFAVDPTGQQITPVQAILNDPSTMFLGVGAAPMIVEGLSGVAGQVDSSKVNYTVNAQRNSLRQLQFAVDALRNSQRITTSQVSDLRNLVPNPNNPIQDAGQAVQNGIQLYDLLDRYRNDDLKILGDRTSVYTAQTRDQASNDLAAINRVFNALPTREQMVTRLDSLSKGTGGQMGLDSIIKAGKDILNAGTSVVKGVEGAATGAPVTATVEQVKRMGYPELVKLLGSPQPSDVLDAAEARLGELAKTGGGVAR